MTNNFATRLDVTCLEIMRTIDECIIKREGFSPIATFLLRLFEPPMKLPSGEGREGVEEVEEQENDFNCDLHFSEHCFMADRAKES